jgi:hypothetical protein
MSNAANIWGTTASKTIASVLESEMSDVNATWGGVLVAQVETASGEVFRASQGWTLELCETCVRIARIGWGSRFCSLSLCVLSYAGDEMSTAAEITNACTNETFAARAA